MGMGCHFLLQGIFLTQGSNPCLLHLLHWQPGPLVPPGKPLAPDELSNSDLLLSGPPFPPVIPYTGPSSTLNFSELQSVPSPTDGFT